MNNSTMLLLLAVVAVLFGCAGSSSTPGAFPTWVRLSRSWRATGGGLGESSRLQRREGCGDLVGSEGNRREAERTAELVQWAERHVEVWRLRLRGQKVRRSCYRSLTYLPSR